jgi:hypothetical protein
MKTILTVKHASGEQEVVCPNCGRKMEFHYGHFSEGFSFGEYTQTEYPDTWDCSCGHSEEA